MRVTHTEIVESVIFGHDDHATITFVDGSAVSVIYDGHCIPSAMIEQLAAVIARRRWSHGDYRDVCEHALTPHGEQCVQCVARKQTAVEVAT